MFINKELQVIYLITNYFIGEELKQSLNMLLSSSLVSV